ncbi:hypothetical protein J2T50_000313 [Streptococcus gallinaceus]|uniref:N-acetylmuramoyl-L-alanine amidase n=1 Tax=Streptococcus gallinaceus TaxID=165758 RepID=UPI00209D06B5|nr:N-acetylmuramoyl-L-alanine amidase [Streptococcus gallinaceus]MCP1638620.1 hypothetical protein [Streptococcus gallinaceus]MCP1769293.1 hypothetical protein [Streptococcus gallinaceus]
MVEKINVNLMNVGRLASIDFVVIHNDAGSMTPEQYINWLRNRNKELGIAHYYINRHTIARVIDNYNIGYHTGEWHSNTHSIGYEVCESLKVGDAEFLANEDMALMQATEDLLFYNLPINHQTVRLHHEFVPTTCPHRSLALHGGTTGSVKDYFVSRMKYFVTLGKTVDEMLAKKGTPSATPQPKPQPSSTKKSIDEVAREVLNGKWGNGAERKSALESAGYSYSQVQERVNALIYGTVPQTKSLDEVAKEVINGQWGNGQDRRNRLMGAGYNYDQVQQRVNELLG